MSKQQIRVRFYRAAKRKKRDPEWPSGGAFPREELVDAVGARSANDDRYVKLGEDVLLCHPGPKQPAWRALSFYRVRHNQLPDEERGGLITPLDLDDSTNLAEGAHVVFFDRNIVGMCTRREGPGRATVCNYIEEVLESTTRRSIEFLPLLRPDVTNLLQGVELVSATVKVAAGNADAIAGLNPTLGAASRDLTEELAGISTTITVQAGRTIPERRQFRGNTLPIFQRIARDAPRSVETLKVEYVSPETGRQVVDLLGDDISVQVNVDIDDARRGLAPATAYDAIRAGYNEALDQLNAAIELLD